MMVPKKQVDVIESIAGNEKFPLCKQFLIWESLLSSLCLQYTLEKSKGSTVSLDLEKATFRSCRGSETNAFPLIALAGYAKKEVRSVFYKHRNVHVCIAEI